jgi:hydroxymethylglutaryl-CoA lyase
MSRPRIRIQEVAPRDGLQAESAFVATADKIAMIDALARTGVWGVEVTSFVSPKAIPTLADAEAVMQGITRVPGVSYGALIPNLRGAERALPFALDEFNVFLSATEGHNQANLRQSREASVRGLEPVIRLAQQQGIGLNLSLSCAFGCPIEGEVAQEAVLDLAARFVDLGLPTITLCDTTGMAYPDLVRQHCEAFLRRFPQTTLALHFHNTRGLGLANIVAALDLGVHRFDTSAAGIGGCPYAPGATGNVCTEDVVHLLHLQGWETGIDLPALIACARGLGQALGRELPGQVMKAGTRLERRPRA